MHASFSMRGKSYKMIQSSSRINDENFLWVVKKMSHNHFEGERTQKWPQEKYILEFSWIILVVEFMVECRNFISLVTKCVHTKDLNPTLADSWHWKKLEFKRLRNSNCIFVKSLQCYFAYANLFLASHLWMM